MSSKLPGANCTECPLREGILVPPEINGDQAVLVGEQPGRGEAEGGRPFIGASGRAIDRALQKANLRRPQLHITNAVACYSPMKLSAEQYNQALGCCAKRLALETSNSKKIITLGSRAQKVYTGRDSAMDWFGYPLPDVTTPGREIFPIFHPALALRKPVLIDVFHHLMVRAALWIRDQLPEWKWPPVHITQTAEALAALKRIAQAPIIGYDVENAGKDPIHAPLLCVGVASEHEAVSLRWPIASDAHYEALQAVLTSPAIKAAHNSQHDRLTLEAYGLHIAPPFFDTLLAHVALHTQLKHSLSFVCGVEFPAPRWKSDYYNESELKGIELWTDANEDMRTYNARDCLMGARLAAKLLKQVNATKHVVPTVLGARTA